MTGEAVAGLDVRLDRHRRWVITLGDKRKATRRKRTMRRLVVAINTRGRWPR